MPAGRTISFQLSYFFSVTCRLFRFSLTLRSFVFNHLQPLLPKQPGSGG